MYARRRHVRLLRSKKSRVIRPSARQRDELDILTRHDARMTPKHAPHTLGRSKRLPPPEWRRHGLSGRCRLDRACCVELLQGTLLSMLHTLFV